VGFARTILAALLAAACGAMLAAAFRLIQSQLSRKRWLRPALIAAGALALARFAGFSPLQVIALAALTGFLWPET
jgi:chromate transport protein ChrA